MRTRATMRWAGQSTARFWDAARLRASASTRSRRWCTASTTPATRESTSTAAWRTRGYRGRRARCRRRRRRRWRSAARSCDSNVSIKDTCNWSSGFRATLQYDPELFPPRFPLSLPQRSSVLGEQKSSGSGVAPQGCSVGPKLIACIRTGLKRGRSQLNTTG